PNRQLSLLPVAIGAAIAVALSPKLSMQRTAWRFRESTGRNTRERQAGLETTLSSAWDQHLASEFDARSADQALATMTTNPHVNLVPLMIGARGRAELRDFYAHHFLNQIPPDMEMVTVSRTIGQGRVVDELIMCFTHSICLDWLLPGIPPT